MQVGMGTWKQTGSFQQCKKVYIQIDLYILQLFISVFSDLFKGCIHLLFKDLFHLHKIDFKVIFSCFSCSEYSRIVVVEQLDSAGAILQQLLLIVFLHWHLGLCIWDDCRSRYEFHSLSQLDGCSVPWFLFLFFSFFFFGLLVLCHGFLAAGVTSGEAGSPHLNWGLDFWWLSWPLVQQCVSVLVGEWDKMMRSGVGFW